MSAGERLSATTTVAAVWGVQDLILSEQLHRDLKAPYGTLTLTAGAPVAVTNQFTPGQAKPWQCGQGPTCEFGSSWKIRSYVATAIFAGCEPEAAAEGRHPGIYLSTTQLDNLNIRRALRPLCGGRKLREVKERSPQAVAIVKLLHRDTVFEVAVYPSDRYLDPPSAIAFNAALYRQLPHLAKGDPVLLCSRFDEVDYQAAATKRSPPEIEREPSDHMDNGLRLFYCNPTAQDLFPDGFKNSFEDRLLLATLFDDLTSHAERLADVPILFLTVIDFMNSLDHSILDSHEFLRLLDAVAKQETTLKRNQEQLLYLLTAQLLEQKDTYHNPPLLTALFTMGVDLQNSAGENCLHLMCRLDRGSYAMRSGAHGFRSYRAFQTWVKAKTPAGKTPLHYLCQRQDWNRVFAMGKKLRYLNAADFCSPQGTPFHALLGNLNTNIYAKALTMHFIVKYLGMGCIDWLDQQDADGVTPIDMLQRSGAASIDTLLHELTCTSFDDEDDAHDNAIIQQLKIRLGIIVQDQAGDAAAAPL